MHSLLKNIFFVVANTFAPPLGGRAAILMYHSISDRSDYFSSVTPQQFKQQMEYLSQNKYAVIPLQELTRRIAAKEDIGNAVVITFDDGYRDNFTEAFPILKEHNFPATIFVTTDLIGQSDTWGMERLSTSEIKEMHASGLIDIEPHTKTHPKLTRCTRDALQGEIIGSKEILEQLLGKQCTSFAYPYGNYDTEVVTAVRASGLSAAVTVSEGTVSTADNLFELKRNSIDRSTTSAQFRGKLTRAVDWYQTIKSWL